VSSSVERVVEARQRYQELRQLEAAAASWPASSHRRLALELVRAELARGDGRISSEPTPVEGVAGLAVALKALVVDAGGYVELSEVELERAAGVLMKVEGTPEVMRLEIVPGSPPPAPMLATEQLEPEPTEVVLPVLPYPLCVCGHRYDHHRHHAPFGCWQRAELAGGGVGSPCECQGYRAVES